MFPFGRREIFSISILGSDEVNPFRGALQFLTTIPDIKSGDMLSSLNISYHTIHESIIKEALIII